MQYAPVVICVRRRLFIFGKLLLKLCQLNSHRHQLCSERDAMEIAEVAIAVPLAGHAKRLQHFLTLYISCSLFSRVSYSHRNEKTHCLLEKSTLHKQLTDKSLANRAKRERERRNKRTGRSITYVNIF